MNYIGVFSKSQPAILQVQMGRQTRSSASSPTKSQPLSKDAPLIDEDPHKVYLLPENVSKDARFLFLKHPRDGSRCQFFFCPEQGLFEITRIHAPPLDPRSILFTPAANSRLEKDKNSQHDVYVNKAAEIHVATPFNPVYIVLPLLDPSIDHSEGDMLDRRQFHSYESYLDEPQTQDRHLHYVLSDPLFRRKVEKAMCDVCDAVEVGDETMYRLNIQRLTAKILRAVLAVAEHLPNSLEERFVVRALEPPLVGEGQTNDLPAGEALDKIRRLQRIQTAETSIKTSYLSPSIASQISLSKEMPESIDFTPLDEYVEALAKLRSAALASRSMSDFKRRNMEDEDAAEGRVEKKRRLEEEEKKKKSQESRGVRDLKKVNVTGMKKMSDFFTKKPPTGKPKG